MTVITTSPRRTPETMILRVRGFTGSSLWPTASSAATVTGMNMRLYAIGMDEVLVMYGAVAEQVPGAEVLRGLAQPEPAEAPPKRWFGRRTAVAVDPDEPTETDIEAFLSGDSIETGRTRAAWRLQERLVAGCSWGALALPYGPAEVDEVDFALARGGVSAAVGLRHLFTAVAPISLVAQPGLQVGWYASDRVATMVTAFRDGLAEVPEAHQSEIAGLVEWLSNWPEWSAAADAAGRETPDLVGFWAHD